MCTRGNVTHWHLPNLPTGNIWPWRSKNVYDTFGAMCETNLSQLYLDITCKVSTRPWCHVTVPLKPSSAIMFIKGNSQETQTGLGSPAAPGVVEVHHVWSLGLCSWIHHLSLGKKHFQSSPVNIAITEQKKKDITTKCFMSWKLLKRC